MKKIIYIVILSFALVIGVAAQKTVTKPVNSAKSQIKKSARAILQKLIAGDQTIFAFSGVESAPAVYDSMNDKFRADSLILNGGVDQFGTHLNVSMDYVADMFDPDRFVIVDGKWSLVIYDTNIYTGVIYGDIPSGEMRMNTSFSSNFAVSRQTEAQFRILGGTDEFSDLEPEGILIPFSASTVFSGGASPTNATLTFF